MMPGKQRYYYQLVMHGEIHLDTDPDADADFADPLIAHCAVILGT